MIILWIVNMPPKSDEAKASGGFSCGCAAPEDDSYISLGSGVITNIEYVKKGEKTYIKFLIDGTPVTLDFDKTKTADYSEIYGTTNIEEGMYYYIYEKGGRLIWSTTPKPTRDRSKVNEKE